MVNSNHTLSACAELANCSFGHYRWNSNRHFAKQKCSCSISSLADCPGKMSHTGNVPHTVGGPSPGTRTRFAVGATTRSVRYGTLQTGTTCNNEAGRIASCPNARATEYLISRGADTSQVYVAAYLGKLDQVKAYIESGSQQVSATDKNQILLGAITGGQATIIEYILDHGADIKSWGIPNRAVGANRKQILELLIDKGADPNPGGHWSPLHITIWHYPRLEMAKALLSHGADPLKDKGEDAWNPMHYAIESEKKDMVRLFLDHSRDKNLLPYAYHAMAGNHKDVLPLFEPYVEISPIHLSCFYGKLDDVKSYLEQGKDIEAQDIGGLSLLQFAVVGCQIEIVDYLIAKGCDVNSKASNGETALHYAANGNDKGEEMVQRLITAGALVEAKDNNGDTPFFYSVSHVSGDLGAAQVLLKHGADINEGNALANAAWRNNIKRMKWLIAKGADVNRRNEDGSTPLSNALQQD
jgi:ankyrin repeat protein